MSPAYQQGARLPLLLHLPPEVRLNIYHHLFKPYRIICFTEVVGDSTITKSKARNFPWGLLLTCKRIHQETYEMTPGVTISLTGPWPSKFGFGIAIADVQSRYLAAATKLILNESILTNFDIAAIVTGTPLVKTVEICSSSYLIDTDVIHSFSLHVKEAEISKSEGDMELLRQPLGWRFSQHLRYACDEHFACFVKNHAADLQLLVPETMVFMDNQLRCPFVLRGTTDLERNLLVSLKNVPCQAAGQPLPVGLTFPQFREWSNKNGADPWALQRLE